MIKKILIGIGAAFLLIIFAGIFKFNILANMEGHDVDGNKIEKINEQIIKSVPPSEFKKLAESGKYTIIDVRTKEEFDEGPLFQNVLNIDYYDPDFEDEVLKKLNPTKKYLIYCRSGNRTGNVLKIMKKLGFQEVLDLQGGKVAWEAKFKVDNVLREN